MKKNKLDTTIFSLCILTPIIPSNYSKQAVAIAFAILLLRIIMSPNINRFILTKVLIAVLFLPGISSALITAPEHLIRYGPILILLIGFPYKKFNLLARTIAYITTGAIAYLFISQIFIAFGNPLAIGFRDSWYPIENIASTNLWDYGYADSLLFERRIFRAAGIFYNPNVLASVLTLYYFMFTISHHHIQQTSDKKNFKYFNIKKYVYLTIASVSWLSIFMTGSRTSIVAIIIFTIFSQINFESLKKLRLKLSGLLIIIGSIVFTAYYLFDILLEGFKEEGSANIKFAILETYLDKVSLNSLLFGGTFNIQFDAEIGSWIGSSGLIGLVGVTTVCLVFYRTVASVRATILAFLLISIGNTLFYGLLTAGLAVILIIITTVLWWQSFNDNSRVEYQLKLGQVDYAKD